jgi:predicted RNase H-like nuclease
MNTFIGVDGCRAGWIAVIWNNHVELRLCATFAEILKFDFDALAVDIPIGLPAIPGRKAEAGVREFLKGKSSSVFSVPARDAIYCSTYAEAKAVNLRLSTGQTSVTLQSFAIAPKIIEVDRFLTSARQQNIHEVHPEVSFATMNGNRAVLSKKEKCDWKGRA